ncbi:MAG: TIGR01459 family HAD-type hydrolase [Hyphomicrobiaceae bacterium]
MTSLTVPVLDGAGALLARYEAIFCDVWGVVHNGVQAYPAAGEALARFRSGGGTVVLLSNAPTPSGTVAALLDQKGVRRDAWDALVTSGDITRAHVRAQGYQRIHHIGVARDLPLFEGLATSHAPLADADAIVCTGLVDDLAETGETYRPMMEQALARALPLICANPDLVVEVGGVLYPCAGAIAAVYEQIGGPVFWAGKPHTAAYEMALATAERLMGRQLARRSILGIGDAIRTDVAGAEGFGIDALFIAGGIHREEIMCGDSIISDRLQRLVLPPAPRPLAAMAELVW